MSTQSSSRRRRSRPTRHQLRDRRARLRSDFLVRRANGLWQPPPPSPIYDPITLAGWQNGWPRWQIRAALQDALKKRRNARMMRGALRG